jgi:hypothetical protein
VLCIEISSKDQGVGMLCKCVEFVVCECCRWGYVNCTYCDWSRYSVYLFCGLLYMGETLEVVRVWLIVFLMITAVPLCLGLDPVFQ